MNSRFRFSYEPDWRTAPLAFWVHVPVPGSPTACAPEAPSRVPHHGFRFLRFEFGEHELVFSSPAQLDQFIEVLSTKPLPTSRRLSLSRGAPVGPNGHWLSRLPAELKVPKTRTTLVRHLRSVRKKWCLAVAIRKSRCRPTGQLSPSLTAAARVRPNPSIERTSSSGLCPLPAAAHVQR